MPAIFRITSLADWETALATGAVPRCAADNRDDCIHVNAADDVARVASAFFSAGERPVALELDQLALAQHLTWLPPSQAKPWPQGRVALPYILISHVLGVHELLPVPGKPSDELAPGTLSSIVKQAG